MVRRRRDGRDIEDLADEANELMRELQKVTADLAVVLRETR